MEQINRKDLILDTFIQLVGRFGVDKTTIQDVARELGISCGVIYQEYRNKETLLDACFLRLSRRFIADCVHTVDRDLPPEQLLYAFVKQILVQMSKFVIKNRGFSQYVKGEAFLEYYRNEERLKDDFKQELLSLIINIMEKGVRQGSFQIENIGKTAALFFDAFYIFFVRLILSDQDLKQNMEDTQLMYSLLLNGLRKR
jgi:AcrR family transcriptional regulator